MENLLTYDNVKEYAKQQNKLFWIESLIDARSINSTVLQLEEEFYNRAIELNLI